jgi:hypothetical protein
MARRSLHEASVLDPAIIDADCGFQDPIIWNLIQVIHAMQ